MRLSYKRPNGNHLDNLVLGVVAETIDDALSLTREKAIPYEGCTVRIWSVVDHGPVHISVDSVALSEKDVNANGRSWEVQAG